jgi:23S rRNA pseudouridine2604 synthase
MNGLDQHAESSVGSLEYVKYWKPKGVVCTTDQRIKGNIIDEITHRSGYRPNHRVYPVGRLDKDSSGLILLTSDGRLPNASLRREQKQPKVYQVTVDLPLEESNLELLRQGVVITTVAQRDGTAKALTAKTKPCLINQIGPTSCNITLLEGRNRQIRKMMEAVGYTVLDLHRIEFGEIKLTSLKREGDWERLNGKEMAWIDTLLQNAE